ncbi:MAG: hypothetical protein NZ108_04605 [Bacteroidia bacterium]|nr:hypothetical protein [Bacteroidia bacterium]
MKKQDWLFAVSLIFAIYALMSLSRMTPLWTSIFAVVSFIISTPKLTGIERFNAVINWVAGILLGVGADFPVTYFPFEAIGGFLLAFSLSGREVIPALNSPEKFPLLEKICLFLCIGFWLPGGFLEVKNPYTWIPLGIAWLFTAIVHYFPEYLTTFFSRNK